MPFIASQGKSLSEGAVNDDRNAVSHRPGGPASETLSSGAAETKDSSIKSEAILRDHNVSHHTLQSRAKVVDKSPARSEWQGNKSPSSGPDNRLGCMSNRLGSRLQWPNASRALDDRRKGGTDQCAGTESNSSHSEDIVEGAKQYSCSLQSRQHNSRVPHQQNGGHTFPEADRNCKGDMGILLREEDTDISGISSRETQCTGRSTITENTGLKRLASGPADGSTNNEAMGQMQNGSVCQQVEHSTTNICELQTRSGCKSSGRLPDHWGERLTLCIPTILPNQQMPIRGVTRQSRTDPDNSNMAHPTLVWHDSEHDHGTTNPLTVTPETAAIAHRSEPSLGGQQFTQTSGMEDFSRQQEARGLSRQSTKLISKSWRSGTRSAYNSAWNKWDSWCSEKETDPFQAPVELIVDYLTSLFEAGYEYSTINGARSAISALHVPIGEAPAGQHSLIKRVMAGVFNERTPKPRYTDTWDVDKVLGHIISLGPNSELSDKHLTHKLAMLLALTTANRASEIQGMDLEYMADKDTHMEFTIQKLTKTRRVGDKPQTITLHQYQDPVLDVVTCTRSYIRRTSTWRTTSAHHKLLLGIVAPHKPVCTSTISNWLKHMMECAGMDVTVYKGHSTRRYIHYYITAVVKQGFTYKNGGGVGVGVGGEGRASSGWAWGWGSVVGVAMASRRPYYRSKYGWKNNC